tara:strand:+ start:624 stop:1067 length:444 start_codon:yes stop_codon:yes gene_type:complete
MNKSTFLINWLEREPLKFSEMNRLMKSVRKTSHGSDWMIETRYGGGRWRYRKDYQGYWNTSLCKLSSGMNPIIRKREDGRYEPTKYGLENKLHPFKKDKETLRRKFKSRIAYGIEKRKENKSYRILEFLEFENANYKLIRKVRIEDI